MLNIENISKSFGRVQALNNVSITVTQGSVHGILGENGAGKTTLMNILFGLMPPDRGRILVNGAAVAMRSPRSAQALGIGMVHQHFKLAPALSVVDNLALAIKGNFGLLHRAALRRRIATLAQSLHWSINPDSIVEQLNVGQQQRVEIIKALCGGGKLLILDEPTAVLTPQEVDDLIPAIRSLADSGITVIFISHKLAEVARLCDTISILRLGQVVFSGPMAQLSAEQIAQYMLGTQAPLPAVAPTRNSPGPARLILQGVSCPNPLSRRSKPLLEDINLSVGAGQIVGIAGVEGNGQTSLIEVILGTLPTSSGTIALQCDTLNRIAGFRRARAFACIPQDRQSEGSVLALSLTANLMVRDYRQPRFSFLTLRRTRAWRQHANMLVRQFDIRCENVDVPMGALSGGNQQKAIIARELHGHPPMILAINPTRGLDIGATAFVLRQLVEARDRGAAVLLIHSDLDELLTISDRVLVMYAGRLRETTWPHTDRTAIGRLMLGLNPLAA